MDVPNRRRLPATVTGSRRRVLSRSNSNRGKMPPA